MDGVALAQVFQIERRNGDDLGVQINHRLSKRCDIPKTGDDGKVEIAAEFSGAVRYACLTAHEQRSHAVRAHRRKDSEYRVRDQVIPLVRETTPTIFRSLSIARPASNHTTPPTPNRRGPRHECAARSFRFVGLGVQTSREWLDRRASLTAWFSNRISRDLLRLEFGIGALAREADAPIRVIVPRPTARRQSLPEPFSGLRNGRRSVRAHKLEPTRVRVIYLSSFLELPASLIAHRFAQLHRTFRRCFHGVDECCSQAAVFQRMEPGDGGAAG
ncbi:MAG: hypothetical protein QOK37_3718 [Thermoanaerobaculia bacterium]|nr:hypothetical protein [Thermoanaerobaculia bacterium]